jgi:hypothetical protein
MAFLGVYFRVGYLIERFPFPLVFSYDQAGTYSLRSLPSIIFTYNENLYLIWAGASARGMLPAQQFPSQCYGMQRGQVCGML